MVATHKARKMRKFGIASKDTIISMLCSHNITLICNAI